METRTQHTPSQKPLYVQGLGVAGGFGCGLEAMELGLRGNEPQPTEAVLRGAGKGKAPLVLMTDLTPLQQYASKRDLRRLDRFSRLALLGGRCCLEDAGIAPGELQDAGLILASGYGATATTFAFLDSCIDDGDALASPTHFSNSVHNAAAAHLATHLDLRGPCCTVSQFEHSFAMALTTARAWLQEGRVQRVLLGAVDEICDVLAYCHARIVPKFDGALPGEGVCFFLLGLQPGSDGPGVCFADAALQATQEPLHADFFIQAAACTQGSQGVNHGALYGAMPCGQALDAAVAVLCLRKGEFFASSGGKGSGQAARPLAVKDEIHCLGKERRGLCSVLRLRRCDTNGGG